MTRTTHHHGADEHVTPCERCGSTDAVHRGLCRRCRNTLRGEGQELPPETRHEPHEADPRPLRNPPWRRRGA